LSAHDTAGQPTSDRGAERQAAGPGASAGEPSASSPQGEEELRAAYEAELSRITATDMLAQAAVSLLNIGAHRLAPGAPEQAHGGDRDPARPERDLEQARDAIDGARALLDILERRIPRELGPLRDALSRLQMAYAREIQPGAGAPAQSAGASGGQPQPPGGESQPASGGPKSQDGGSKPDGARQAPEQDERPGGPGPAEASGRLWVPGR
jgi:hypothetical protein